MPAAPVILITGAAKRIGAAIARRLHADGCDLALHYRHSATEMQALVAELEQRRPNSTLALAADLTDIPALPGLIERVLARFGRLDGLVNNASAFYATPLADCTEVHWDELMATNAKAPFFLTQAAAPALRASGGAVVNLVDIYGQRPLVNHPIYSISKAALHMSTRVLAQALGPDVRVNGVALGTALWADKPVKAENLEQVQRGTALRRIGSPSEVADAVKFLLFDASYCTGVVLAVDGGRLLSVQS